MAISPKNQEKLDALEASLRAEGKRLSATAIAAHGPELNSRKLQDALRASIYIAGLHERGRAGVEWDNLISVDELMAVIVENI